MSRASVHELRSSIWGKEEADRLAREEDAQEACHQIIDHVIDSGVMTAEEVLAYFINCKMTIKPEGSPCPRCKQDT